jgi:hypothetical protein
MKEMRYDFNNLHDGIERCFLSTIDMAAGLHTMMALWSLICMEAILLAFLAALVCCLLSCCCFGYSHGSIGRYAYGIYPEGGSGVIWQMVLMYMH